jgi:hypothetical protein
MSNLGIGNISQDKESVKLFSKIGEIAKEKDIIINLITFGDSESEINILMNMIQNSGGEKIRVNPQTIKKIFPIFFYFIFLHYNNQRHYNIYQ